MNEKFYETASNLVEEIISNYMELLDFYKEKKQALLTRDREMLSFVDEKIMLQVKDIEGINKKMLEFCKENELEMLKVSDLINLANNDKSSFSEVFEKQKVKINEVSHGLALVEKANVELIKHGLIMSDKLLDIIISAAVPQKDNYDMHGKNINTTELGISSIVEDA